MESEQSMNHDKNEAPLEAIPQALRRTVHELFIHLFLCFQPGLFFPEPILEIKSTLSYYKPCLMRDEVEHCYGTEAGDLLSKDGQLPIQGASRSLLQQSLLFWCRLPAHTPSTQTRQKLVFKVGLPFSRS